MFDVRDVVDKLKIKAISKIREFLLQRVYQFRKPLANYQMLQSQLLNYKSVWACAWLHVGVGKSP